MKKTIIAFSVAAMTIGSAASAFAGSGVGPGAKNAAIDVPCRPAKDGYIMVGGKCVKKPLKKTQ